MLASAADGGGDGDEEMVAVKKSKAEKDPNKPKRPPSAFFIFMDTFMKDYMEKHPNVKKVFVPVSEEKWKTKQSTQQTEAMRASYIPPTNNRMAAGGSGGDGDEEAAE
ncbi:hypothetical protein ZWY2020_025705, partial [Hordeum vulgare]